MNNNFASLQGEASGLSLADLKANQLKQALANNQAAMGYNYQAEARKLKDLRDEVMRREDIGLLDRAGNAALGVLDSGVKLAGDAITAIPTFVNESDAVTNNFTAADYALSAQLKEKEDRVNDFQAVADNESLEEDVREQARKEVAKYSPEQYTEEEKAFAASQENGGISRKLKVDVYLSTREDIKSLSDLFENNYISDKVDRAESNEVIGNITETANKAGAIADSALDKIFDGDMGEGLWELTGALKDLAVDTGSELLDNPGLIPQTLAESLPTMVSSAKKLPLTLGAMMTGAQREAVEGYIAENGKLPTGADRDVLNLSSAASGTLDLLGDRILAGAVKPAKGIVGKVRNVTATGAGEALAEGGAALASDYAVKQDASKLDYAAAYANASLGAASGSTLSITSETAGAVADVVTGKIEANKEATKQANPKTQDIAVEVAKVAPKENKEYLSPYVESAKVVQDAINKVDVEPTPENQTAAFEAVIGMVNSMGKLQKSATTEEEMQAIVKVQAADKFYKQTLGILSVANNDVKLIQKLGQGTATEEEIKTLKPVAMQVLYNSNISSNGVGLGGAVDADYVSTLETVLTTPSLIEGVKPEVIAAAQQKLTALKELGDVATDIAKGNTDDTFFRGAEQYYTAARELVEQGDMEGAQAEIDQFNEFAQGHIAKAEAAEATLTERHALQFPKGENDPGVPLTSFVNGKEVQHLQLAEDPKTGKIKPIGEPTVIHKGSGKLVAAIMKEADYLTKASVFINGLTNPTVISTEPEVNTKEEVDVPVLNEAADANTQGELFDEVGGTNEPTVEEEVAVEEGTETAPVQGELNLNVDTGVTAELDARPIADTTFKPTELTNVTDEHRINAVVTYFTNNTESPMGQVGNLTTQLTVGSLEEAKKLLGKFTDTSRMNNADMITLKGFNGFNKQFGTKLRTNLEASYKAVTAEGKLGIGKKVESPTLYLFNDKGELPQKVVDALAMTAWNWIMYESGDAAYNTGTDINRILGGDGDKEVYNPELTDIGMVKSVVTDYLGSMSLDMLGLKANGDTRIKLYDGLKGDIAATILFVLGTPANGVANDKRMAIIKATAMPGKKFKEYQIEAGIQGAQNLPETNRSFIKLNADFAANKVNPTQSHALITKVRSIASTESSRITERLGDPRYQSNVTYIGKAPAKVKQVPIKGTDRFAAPDAVKAHNIATSRKFYPNKNMFNLLLGKGGLGEGFIRTMLGYSETDIGYRVSDLARKGLNNTIDSAIENAKGFAKEYSTIEDGTPVFFDYQFVSQTRHMMKGNFNPQREKLHRFMMGFKKDTLSKNNPNDMVNFKLAVAQGLGLKTDKLSHTDVLIELDNLLENDVIKAALYDLRQGLKGNQMDPENILPAVTLGKEKTASFKALLAYAEYLEADSGTFETDIMYEIDGVTNGPFHAQLQLGLVNLTNTVRGTLSRGGLYNSTVKVNHNQNSKNDNYISTANVVSAHMSREAVNYSDNYTSALNVFKDFASNHISVVDGEFTISRNLAKGPTTTVTYGAGTLSNNIKLMDQSLDGLNEIIDNAIQVAEQDIVGANAELQIAIDAIERWNSLLSIPVENENGTVSSFEGKTYPILNRLGLTNARSTEEVINKLKNFEFTVNEKNHMVKLYGATFGKAFEEGIANTLGAVQESGKQLNLMASVMHKLHNSEVTTAVDKLMGESTSIFGPTRSDVANAVRSLAPIAPSFKPYFATEGEFDNYVPVTNKRVREGDVVGRALLGGGDREIYGTLPTFDEPSVRSLPFATIHVDASTSMLSNLIGESDHLNVWDGFFISPNQIGSMTKTLNTADLIVNRDWNMFSEFADQLENTINNHPVLGNADLSYAEKQSYFLDTLYGDKAKNFSPFTQREISALIEMKLLTGTYDNNNRLNGYDSSTILSENATYLPHALVQIMRAQGNVMAANKSEVFKSSSYNQFVGKEGSQIATTSLGTIAGMNKSTLGWIKSYTKTVEKEVEPFRTLKENSKNTATVLEGTSFKGKEAVTGLIDLALASLGKGDPTVRAVQGILADTLKDNINENIEVIYQDFTNSSFNSNDYGVYYSGKVYINSNPSIVASAEKVAETILHELVHGTSAETVHGIKTGALKGTAQQNKAVRELESTLKWMTKNFTKDPALAQQFPTAFTNLARRYYSAKDDVAKAAAINELIAYGLTDEAVARTLSKQTSKSTLAILNTILNAIKQLLGFKPKASALTDVLAAYYTIATKNIPEVKKPSKIETLYSDNYERSSQGIFDSLRGGTTAEDIALDKALNEIESAVIGKLETSFNNDHNIETAADKVLYDQISDEVKTTANKLSAVGFKMSEKESMVYQLYAEVLSTSMADKYHSKNEIRRVYQYAKATLDASIFTPLNATADEVLLAKAKFDAVFNSRDPEVDVLGNFAALAKTNTALRDALNTLSLEKAKIKDASTVVGGIEVMVRRIYSALVSRLAHTSNDTNVLTKLDGLSKRITHIKAKKATLLESGISKADTVMALSDSYIKAAAAKTARGALRYFPKTRGSVVVASVLNTVSREEPQLLKQAFKDLANIGGSKPLNAFQELGQEVLGVGKESEPLHELRRTAQYQTETKREAKKRAVAANINELLKVSAEESAAVTRFLRTDVTSLIVNGMSLNRVTQLVNEPTELQQEIDNQIKLIQAEKVPSRTRNFYINSAIGLGKYMATGLTYSAFQLTNAYAIADGLGTNFNTANNTAFKAIDTLATLVALQESDLSLVSEVLAREPKGIQHVLLKQHQTKQAAINNFGTQAQYAQVKGYMFDITNPNKAATFGKPKEEKLLHRGYVEAGRLRMDKHNQSNESIMYVSEDAGNVNFVSGVMSTINTLLDGVDPVTGRVGKVYLPSETGRGAVRDILARKQSDIDALGSANAIGNPVHAMIPTIDVNGTLVGFRYEMSHAEKDNILDRENNIADIMGAWAGRIDEEAVSGVYNKQLVTVLKDRFDNARYSERKNFIAVGPNTTNKRIREIYYLMPKELRDEIKTQFGTSTLYVHKEDLNNAIGYRELSVLQLWDNKDRNQLAKALVTMAEMITPQAGVYLRKGERRLQELVSEVKDWIVIKSVVVSVGNMISNVMQLHLRGVSIKDITSDTIKAVEAASAYRKAQAEKLITEDLLNASFSSADSLKLQVKINELNQELKSNPVRELVEAGMLPTISEDISQHDKYSVKHSIISKISNASPFEKQSPDSLIENLLITQDSKTYTFLNASVEMGDFTAKYVMYNKYLKEGLSKEAAMRKIAVEFIDYGALSSRELDYLNKTGMLHFFKYTLRIPIIVGDILAKQPTRFLLFLLGQGATGVDVESPVNALTADFGAKMGLMDLLRGFGAHPLLP